MAETEEQRVRRLRRNAASQRAKARARARGGAPVDPEEERRLRREAQLRRREREERRKHGEVIEEDEDGPDMPLSTRKRGPNKATLARLADTENAYDEEALEPGRRPYKHPKAPYSNRKEHEPPAESVETDPAERDRLRAAQREAARAAQRAEDEAKRLELLQLRHSNRREWLRIQRGRLGE